MAWRPYDPLGGGPAPPAPESNGSTPWHILAGETITVATRREYALHGEFLLEGDLVLEGSARLILEN